MTTRPLHRVAVAVAVIIAAAALPLLFAAAPALAKVQPTLTTSTTPSAQVPADVSDSAVLSGFPVVQGSIVFSLFGPNDPTCTHLQGTATVPVTANGTYNSGSFHLGHAGTFSFTAHYSGDANNLPADSPCGADNETVVITQFQPIITTTATPSVVVGGSIGDSATLTGLNPTGAIHFNAYSPGDTTCTGPVYFTSPVMLTAGNGTYSSALSPPTTAAGTYRWVASYTGDSDNKPVTSPCNASGETSTVTPRQPTISTAASGSVPVGGQITDTAMVLNAAHPTGNVGFSLFGPSDTTCAGPPVATSNGALDANGGATSAPFTANVAGTYRWIASYVGDANNTAAGPTSCSDPAEQVVVSALVPQIAVTKSAAPATRPAPGGAFTFTVQVSNPSTNDPIKITSLTDDVYGDTTTIAGSSCGALIGTTLAPGASSTPCSFTGSFTGNPGDGQTDEVTAKGVDSANNTATATAHATVSLTKAVPTMTTAATSNAVNAAISDSATIAGGSNPTGTVTFRVYGPNNATCSGNPASGSSATVAGNGSYASAPFTPTLPGAYRWIASYSGDAKNLATTGSCGDAGETSTVTCSSTIGPNGGSVASGSTACATGGTVTGNIVVQPGGSLVLNGAHVTGGVSSSGASSVTICASTIDSNLSVSNASGLVRIGNAAQGCAPNNVHGGLSLNGNHGGIEVIGNTIGGTVSVNTNTGPPLVVSANVISGALSCNGNTPAPTGSPNTAATKSGQCAAV